MQSVMQKVEAKYKKSKVVDVMSGDSVKVHQKIREGNKERVQIFEGTVIRVTRKNSPTSSLTVRRVASGVGVEKTYLLHSPSVLKIEVTKRSKARRNYLTYLRQLTGKSTRMISVEFDREAVNAAAIDEEAEAEEEKLKAEAEKQHEIKEAKKAEEAAKTEAKVEEALKKHEDSAVDSPAETEKDK